MDLVDSDIRTYFKDLEIENYVPKIAELPFGLHVNCPNNYHLTNLELETLSGTKVKLHDLKSKFVAVYFWDPDCGNCSKMSTKLVGVYSKYKDQGLQIFGICNKTYKELAKCTEKEKEKSMDWINTADPYGLGQAHYKYYIQANPTLYLLDKDKVIRYKRIDADQLDEILERELADKS